MSISDENLNKFLLSDTINDDLIKDIVATKLNMSPDKFDIKLVLITPAVKPNENYAGFVVRIKIKFQNRETMRCDAIDVIVKISFDTISSLNEFNVYQREKFVYENVLTYFERLWHERANEEVRFAARSLKFVDGENQLIVLEDLKTENYRMLDRKEGLSLQYSKCFLSLFAKFHAAGAVAYKEVGTMNDCLDRQSPSAPKPDINSAMATTFNRILKEFKKVLRRYGDCDSYADKIDKWDELIFSAGYLHASDSMKCGLQVLNHGDIWTNNIMFQSDPNKNVMVDFQLSFWGSPTYDLLAFFALSVHDDVKVKHFDELVEFYYQEFTGSLKKLSYEHHIPSFDEFKDDLMEKGYILAGFLPFLFFAKYSSQVEFSFETLIQEKDKEVLREVYDRLFLDEYFIKALKVWLPFLDERGFLDTLIPKPFNH